MLSETFPIVERITNSIKLVFINGNFNEAASDLNLLPKNVIYKVINDVSAGISQSGVSLIVPSNVTIKPIIHCLFMTTKDNVLNNYRHEFMLQQDSQATVLMEYQANADTYLTNEEVKIETQNGARLEFYKIQNEASNATHTSNAQVEQQENSYLKTCLVTQGAKYARENISVNLHAAHANCSLYGLYNVSRDKQQSDNYIQMNHLASHTQSEMHYKGIADKKSRAVFNGKIYVAKHAQKITAEQANHNLLLSKEAEISTKPEFEIYADDVKCKHGATVGQLDPDALFYLRSRGIEKVTAMQLLTHAFATSILDRVTHTVIKEYMQHLIKEVQ